MEEKEQKKKGRGNILRVFRYARPWSVHLVFATLTLMLVTACNLAGPSLIRRILQIAEAGGAEGGAEPIIFLIVLIAVLYLLRLFFQFANNYLAHIAAWNTVSNFRQALYAHMQKLSLSFYKDKQTGQLMSRVINDTDAFELLIAHALPDLITNVLIFAGVFIILFVINPFLALLAVAPIPFLVLFALMLRKIRKYFKKRQIKTAELNALLQDNFSGIKEIQVFNKQRHEESMVSLKTKEHVDYTLKGIFYVSWLHPSINLLTSIGSLLVVGIAAILIVSGSNLGGGIKYSDIVGFLLYLNLLYAPVSALSRVMEDLQLSSACAERTFEIMDTMPDIADRPGAVSVGRLSGQVSFENVSFDYDKSAHIIKDVSFSARAGEMIALVGPTGSGKSTLVSLIARFYDPEKGAITMDGINTRDIKLECLRNQISIVLQDVFLFNGTIAENILYGTEGGATLSEVTEAARAARIHDFIIGLPEGYDTMIGERGVRLSGGQKQRLAIARALIRNAPVLILDEATSAVDNETEKGIQQAVASIAGTRTLIVIAHRLSTVRRADKILFLSGGSIIESGTHEELLAKSGEYAKLYFANSENGTLGTEKE